MMHTLEAVENDLLRLEALSINDCDWREADAYYHECWLLLTRAHTVAIINGSPLSPEFYRRIKTIRKLFRSRVDQLLCTLGVPSLSYQREVAREMRDNPHPPHIPFEILQKVRRRERRQLILTNEKRRRNDRQTRWYEGADVMEMLDESPIHHRDPYFS